MAPNFKSKQIYSRDHGSIRAMREAHMTPGAIPQSVHMPSETPRVRAPRAPRAMRQDRNSSVY